MIIMKYLHVIEHQRSNYHNYHDANSFSLPRSFTHSLPHSLPLLLSPHSFSLLFSLFFSPLLTLFLIPSHSQIRSENKLSQSSWCQLNKKKYFLLLLCQSFYFIFFSFIYFQASGSYLTPTPPSRSTFLPQ